MIRVFETGSLDMVNVARHFSSTYVVFLEKNLCDGIYERRDFRDFSRIFRGSMIVGK